jgi:DNA-binding NtrC family response regulator
MPGHVVIVEDDDDFRYLMGLSLTHQGFEVAAFESAVSALDYIEGNAARIDGMVADMVLVHGNGLEVCRKLAVRNPKASIVVLSGDNRMVQSATEAGFMALLKPVPMDVLTRALDRSPKTVA